MNNDNQIEHVAIYTDGSVIGNPGPGGYGAIMLRYMGNELLAERRISKPWRNGETTTSPRMELEAAIHCLRMISHKERPVVIYSDSQYLVDGMTKHLAVWLSNDWRTSDKKAVKNRDQWEALRWIAANFNVTWVKVAGHSGNLYNEAADRLAGEAANRAMLLAS